LRSASKRKKGEDSQEGIKGGEGEKEASLECATPKEERGRKGAEGEEKRKR